jgi:hypothetical protein
MEVRKQQHKLFFSRVVLMEQEDLAGRQDYARSLLLFTDYMTNNSVPREHFPQSFISGFGGVIWPGQKDHSPHSMLHSRG